MLLSPRVTDNVCVNNGEVDDACDSGESEEQTCTGKDKEYCQIMCTNCTGKYMYILYTL